MRLGEMNWMEIENYLKKDDRLLIVLGANEQHGFLEHKYRCKNPPRIGRCSQPAIRRIGSPPVEFRLFFILCRLPGNHQHPS